LVLPKNSPEAERLCLEERGLYQWHRRVLAVFIECKYVD